MIKSPIQKVTDNLQNRAIGIIYASYKPSNTDSLNKGILKDQNNLTLDAVVLGKTLPLIKKYIDFNKKYFFVVYPRNKNSDCLHLQIAGIWDPISLNKEQKDHSQNSHEILKNFELTDVNKAGAKFNWEKLNWINSQYIKSMNVNDLYEIFKKYWQEKAWKPQNNKWGLELTNLLQDSITVLNDIIDQSAPFFVMPKIDKDGEVFLKENSKLSLEKVYELLNQEDIQVNKTVAKNIIDKVSLENSLKKSIVMRSLRVAFFGCLSGPDLVKSWELFSANKNDIERIQRCLDTN